jgi:hypothetical protein
MGQGQYFEKWFVLAMGCEEMKLLLQANLQGRD